jgi:hypothetical protein
MEIRSQYGAKDRELADMVASAEIRDLILRDNEVLIHFLSLQVTDPILFSNYNDFTRNIQSFLYVSTKRKAGPLLALPL